MIQWNSFHETRFSSVLIFLIVIIYQPWTPSPSPKKFLYTPLRFTFREIRMFRRPFEVQFENTIWLWNDFQRIRLRRGVKYIILKRYVHVCGPWRSSKNEQTTLIKISSYGKLFDNFSFVWFGSRKAEFLNFFLIFLKRLVRARFLSLVKPCDWHCFPADYFTHTNNGNSFSYDRVFFFRSFNLIFWPVWVWT